MPPKILNGYPRLRNFYNVLVGTELRRDARNWIGRQLQVFNPAWAPINHHPLRPTDVRRVKFDNIHFSETNGAKAVGKPDLSASGEVTVPARQMPPSTSLPNIEVNEPKIKELDSAITRNHKPRVFRFEKMWKTIATYGAFILAAAAMPFASVSLSLGALFPLILGKSALAVATTLVGTNALLGGVIGFLAHLGLNLRSNRRAEKSIKGADRELLAERLLKQGEESAATKAVLALYPEKDQTSIKDLMEIVKIERRMYAENHDGLSAAVKDFMQLKAKGANKAVLADQTRKFVEIAAKLDMLLDVTMNDGNVSKVFMLPADKDSKEMVGLLERAGKPVTYPHGCIKEANDAVETYEVFSFTEGKIIRLSIPRKSRADAAQSRRQAETVADELIPLDSGDIPPSNGSIDLSNFQYTGTVSHYKEVGVIGKGGMGEVLLVESTTGQKFALKKSILLQSSSSEAASEAVTESTRGFLERLWQEFYLGKKLVHENICPTVDTNIDGLFPDVTDRQRFKHTFDLEMLRGKDIFIVTEFVPERPGSDNKAPNLEGEASSGMIPKRALRLFMPVIGALRHAHSMGVFHRDIKPKNIVLTRDRQGREKLVIIDFGIAKDTSEESHTAMGQAVGSPFYVAPLPYTNYVAEAKTIEDDKLRIEAKNARNALIDIYELGITMLECLIGGNPLREMEQEDFYTKYFVNPAGHFNYLEKGLEQIHDTGLREIIRRMVSADPQRNFQSMDEVAQAFNTLPILSRPSDSSTVAGRKTADPPPRGGPGSFAPEAFERTAAIDPKAPGADALLADKEIAPKSIDPYAGNTPPLGMRVPPEPIKPSTRRGPTPPPAPSAPRLGAQMEAMARGAADESPSDARTTEQPAPAAAAQGIRLGPNGITEVSPVVAALDQAIKSKDPARISEAVDDFFGAEPFKNEAEKDGFVDNLYDRMRKLPKPCRKPLLDLLNYFEEEE